MNEGSAPVVEGRRQGQKIKNKDEKDNGRKEKESCADASAASGIAGI